MALLSEPLTKQCLVPLHLQPRSGRDREDLPKPLRAAQRLQENLLLPVRARPLAAWTSPYQRARHVHQKIRQHDQTQRRVEPQTWHKIEKQDNSFRVFQKGGMGCRTGLKNVSMIRGSDALKPTPDMKKKNTNIYAQKSGRCGCYRHEKNTHAHSTVAVVVF